MANMTKAQLLDENAALRATVDQLRSTCEQLANELAAKRNAQQQQPAYQLAAQQRRAQYDAAVAQGRRVKFVGHVLVDY